MGTKTIKEREISEKSCRKSNGHGEVDTVLHDRTRRDYLTDIVSRSLSMSRVREWKSVNEDRVSKHLPSGLVVQIMTLREYNEI